MSLDVMAKTAEPALEVLYPQFYLEGTDNHTPTCSASSDAGRPNHLQGTSEEEARFAVHLGHHLILRLLAIQNRYFSLDLDDAVQKRIDAFVTVWGATRPIRLNRRQRHDTSRLVFINLTKHPG